MKKNLTIVTPIYNDWDCLSYLTADIEKALGDTFNSIHLLVVNDCSTEEPIDFPAVSNNIKLSKVDLVTNIGHQRAILVGLCYCFEHLPGSDYFVVMDSDGEDDPKYIRDLVIKCEQGKLDKVIFAERAKRSESRLFILLYIFYKIFFRILTGYGISYGNFSCIPKRTLSRICNEPNFWNHYSASIRKSKVPFDSVSTARSKRYAGSSKMNVDHLIIHGLSSLSVYIGEIIVRVLKASVLVVVVLVVSAFVVLYIKYFTSLAVPGWATFVFGLLFNVLVTVLLFNLLLILSHLNNRNQHLEKPLSFYGELIKDYDKLHT